MSEVQISLHVLCDPLVVVDHLGEQSWGAQTTPEVMRNITPIFISDETFISDEIFVSDEIFISDEVNLFETTTDLAEPPETMPTSCQELWESVLASRGPPESPLQASSPSTPPAHRCSEEVMAPVTMHNNDFIFVFD